MPMLKKPLTDSLLRAELSKLAPGVWSDPATEGLYVWVGQPNRANIKAVKFHSRITVSPTFRPRDYLGPWRDQNPVQGITCDQAKLAFLEKKQAYKDPKAGRAKRAAKSLPLGEAIELYVERRKKGDKQTAPGGRALPKGWDANLGRFKEMMKVEIERGVLVSDLDRDVFVARKDEYLKNCLIAGHERMRLSMKAKRTGEGEIKDHRLRGIFSAMGPMLGWFVKKEWLNAGDIADLRPEQYPDDTRFLYPGEWQAVCPQFDALDNDAGLFPRFLTLTASRVSAALAMKWEDLPTWGDFETIEHEGKKIEAAVWVARHTKGSDSVVLLGEDAEPQRLLLIGESLEIVKRMRVLWEQNRKANPRDAWDLVFTREVHAKWASCPSHWQRRIERAVPIEKGEPAFVPFDRHGLRRTHATYMKYVGCPKHLVSASLTHVMENEDSEASEMTDIYTVDDVGSSLDDNDPLRQVAPFLLRLQKLLRDFERGHVSPAIEKLQKKLLTGKKSAAMRKRYGVPLKWINLVERSKVPKLAMVK